jgi:hypothetical protein
MIMACSSVRFETIKGGVYTHVFQPGQVVNCLSGEDGCYVRVTRQAGELLVKNGCPDMSIYYGHPNRGITGHMCFRKAAPTVPAAG